MVNNITLEEIKKRTSHQKYSLHDQTTHNISYYLNHMYKYEPKKLTMNTNIFAAKKRVTEIVDKCKISCSMN